MAPAGQEGGAGFLPLRTGKKEKPPVPLPHSQAVLTNFSPTGWHLAPLSHPHLPIPRAEPCGGPKVKEWGRGSKGLWGEGVIREFPRSGQSGGSFRAGRVSSRRTLGPASPCGEGVLGRWAGSHTSPPRVENAFRTLPPTSQGRAVQAGWGWGSGGRSLAPSRGDSRLWLQSP